MANPTGLESDSKPDLDLETPFVDVDHVDHDAPPDLERPVDREQERERDRDLDGDAVRGVDNESGEDAAAGGEVDEILGQLHEGLQKAEATMASILEGIVADNASVLADLEAALTDMEAALASE